MDITSPYALYDFGNESGPVIDPTRILAFLKKYGLGQRVGAGLGVRVKPSFKGEYNPIIYFGDTLPEKLRDIPFPSTYAADMKALYNKEVRDPNSGKPFYASVADNPQFLDSLARLLNKSAEDAKKNLKRFSETQSVNPEFMDNIFYQLQGKYTFLCLDHTFSPPKITYSSYLEKSGLEFLEDEIALKFYLLPFLAGNSNLWLRARECQECGKLFPYKQERARFCSSQCGMKEANRKRRGKK